VLQDTTLGDGCSIGVAGRLPEVVLKSIANTPLSGWPDCMVIFESLTVAYSLDDEDQDV